MTRIKKLLLFVLIAAMTVALSLGIVACGEEKTVTYTVTVTCEDESVLSVVKALLEKDGKKSEDKALSGGKASFELEAGSYTVVLTGVPEEYTYTPKTVTESAPNASVTLTKLNEPDGKVFYTVNVTCADEAVLSGVKVKLMLGTAAVEEQALTDGKATFKLAPGNYIVTLTGVPAGYTYETKTFTSPNSAVTIALTKVSSSADITVKVAAGKDMFGQDRPETLLQNAQVDFYRSETDMRPVASATTNGSGVAHFDPLAAGTYRLSVNGKEIPNFVVKDGAATVTLNEKLGSEVAPLVWTVGENEVPFTQEVLDSLAGEGTDAGENIYYTLVVQEGGVYSFDADENALVTSDIFEDGLSYTDRHLAVTLAAGTVYTFACSSGGEVNGTFGYTVTVTKGNTQEGGGDAPETPWAGSGTQADPYIITSLKNLYRVQIKYENGEYVPVYFKYTETAAAKYAIYSSDENFFMTVGSNHYMGGGNASSEQSLFETAAGTSYVFVLSPYDDEGTASVTVSFTIGDYTGYSPKWEGSGVFSTQLHKDDPFIVTTLADSYEVHGADRVYFKYTATETKNYTVTIVGTDGFDFLLRNYNGGNPDNGTHYTLNASQKTAVISLTQGTTYLFGVLGGSDGLDGNMGFAVKFTISEGGTPGTDTPDVPEKGSKNDPYTIENILGENTLKVSSAGLYYTFTVSQTGTYTFTAETLLYLADFQGGNGKTFAAFSGSKVGATKDYELIAGIAYTFKLTGYGPDAASATEVKLKAEFKSAAAEVVIPSEFDGIWKDVNGDYVLEIANGKLTLKKGGTAVETIVTSQASQAMAGKTSYYVTFEGKTYTLQWNSVGDNALQLYLNTNDAIYFAPEPLPAFTFDMTQQGEYASRDGQYPKHIVVSASGMTWEGHKIILLSDMTEAYDGYDKAFAAYVDGKPELLLFGNDAIYFEKAKVYFDDVKASTTVTLPDEYVGNWKSADGKIALNVTASAVVLKENGTQATVTLKQKKVGSATEYYLVWKDKDWEFVSTAQGVLTLQGETNIHFAKDPLPTVDLTAYIGVYRSSLSVDYLVVEKNAIKWGDRTVTLAAQPSSSMYGTGYPFFADGTLYLFFIEPDGETLMLINNDGGEDAELTKVGDTIPQADGSEANPFVLENFLGAHTFPNIPAAGVYYAFDLPFEANLTLTAKTANITVEVNGSPPWQVSRVDETIDSKFSGMVTLKLSGATEISLTIAMNYTVTVTGADKDVYGNNLNETAKAGVSVSLVKGGTSVKTAQTNDKGVVTFSVTEAGDYSVKIDDTAYSFTGANCVVALLSNVVLGSSAEHPLSLKMGANEFPLTQAIMEQYNGAFYSFTCTYSGKYIFTVSEQYAMFMLSDDEPIVMLGNGSLSQTVSLEKGKTYAAMVISQGTTEFAFTLTIGLDVGDIEGSGTKADPEVLKNFNSVARFAGTDANTAYYFSFLTDKSYSVVIKVSKNCRIGGGLVGSAATLNANGTITVNLKKGVAADFYVMAFLNEGADIIELTFTATEVADAPWDGSGTSADPYRPENFAGDYELNVTANKYIYFEYTATKDTTYKVTYLSGVAVTFYLPSGTNFTGTTKNSLPSSQTTGTFSIKAGTKLTFRLYPDQTGDLKFKIEEV